MHPTMGPMQAANGMRSFPLLHLRRALSGRKSPLTVSTGCIRIPIPAQPPDSGCLSQSAPSMVSSSTAAFPALKL